MGRRERAITKKRACKVEAELKVQSTLSAPPQGQMEEGGLDVIAGWESDMMKSGSIALEIPFLVQPKVAMADGFPGSGCLVNPLADGWWAGARTGHGATGQVEWGGGDVLSSSVDENQWKVDPQGKTGAKRVRAASRFAGPSGNFEDLSSAVLRMTLRDFHFVPDNASAG